MSTEKKLRFETLQLHVGQENPDPATDARAVPIYQTTYAKAIIIIGIIQVCALLHSATGYCSSLL